jgi:small conductance mechanosensitive channel
LGQLGIPTAQFAALIAAAGLAIGLALQGNLANFASGFLLVFFRPFKRGDYLTAGGAEGIVEEIGIFTTTLVSLDNKKIVVPNSAITGGQPVGPKFATRAHAEVIGLKVDSYRLKNRDLDIIPSVTTAVAARR